MEKEEREHEEKQSRHFSEHGFTVAVELGEADECDKAPQGGPRAEKAA